MSTTAANVLSEKDANNSLKNQTGAGATKSDVKSMEYHRQVLKSKMEEEKYGRHQKMSTTTTTTTTTTTGLLGTTTVTTTAKQAPSSMTNKTKTIVKNKAILSADLGPNNTSASQQYVSPSDGIMSPCTAKLTALKGRHAGKAKPKSLFAQASAKKFDSENVLGARTVTPSSSSDRTAPLGK
ncbi:hypothetical protein GGS20DRAFT_590600 [Poronia punctata]|nr:hypothetical protein GGS20DRAFT_590600 [Poronia punctata]